MSSRRITLVADELLGLVRTGGIGTATTFLALGLARLGHRVEILLFGDAAADRIDEEWAGVYESARVRIRSAPPVEGELQPAFFERMKAVEQALRSEPPEVAVVQDLGAPAYSAIRLRRLGLAFRDTSFVVYCHGTRQWVTNVARKVRVLPGALAVGRLEQMSVELADAAVSPSAYMLDWMRGQRWRLPERSVVIPLLTRSGAMGEPPPKPVPADTGTPVSRIVFFGRLEERKGVRPLLSAVESLPPELLCRIELEFVGRATPAWTPERVEAILSDAARASLRGVVFETGLDQQEALARLARPGTVAIVPSIEDNSPNAVYECLERGIPLLASAAGGIGELIAPEDRARLLFEPTADGIAEALRRALADGVRPARPAFDAASSLARWGEVVAMRPQPVPIGSERPHVGVVVVDRGSTEVLARCLGALDDQSYDDAEVVVERTREAGLAATGARWIVFLDAEDVPERDLLETLVRAQAASGADVVSCALRVGSGDDITEHYFAGEPGGLGALANSYGTVALIRRSLLEHVTAAWPAADPDWPLLAELSTAGARIVSVPLPLVTRATPPGTLERQPTDALLVVEHFERVLPRRLRSLARLAAGLGAGASSPPPAPVARRAVRVLRQEGPAGLARRTLRRAAGRSA